MEEGDAHREQAWSPSRSSSAQKKVEGHNFEIRKHLLEYDDVMNKQREVIYALRREMLEGQDQREYLQDVAQDILDGLLDEYAPAKQPTAEDWDLANLALNLLPPVRPGPARSMALDAAATSPGTTSVKPDLGSRH